MSLRCFRAAALAAALVTTACATAPASGPAAGPEVVASSTPNPVGTFNFRSNVQGRDFDGIIRIARAESGAYTGTVTTPLTGELSVRSVHVQGSSIRVTAQGRMGDAVLTMNFTGANFTGDWTYGPSSGRMTGSAAHAA
ncbi:MAG TPA: hypothetical protein VGB66_03805 [Longimicrobium sp.]|jgi:hypothetical protein